MKIKKITLVFTVIFTAAMITLTFAARGIRENYMLPNVRVSRPVMAQYEEIITYEEFGEVLFPMSGLAIEKETYDRIMEELGGIFVVQTRQKNNETRSFVRRVYVQFKTETDEHYIIERGISRYDFFITESNKPLDDGDEAVVLS